MPFPAESKIRKECSDLAGWIVALTTAGPIKISNRPMPWRKAERFPGVYWITNRSRSLYVGKAEKFIWGRLHAHLRKDNTSTYACKRVCEEIGRDFRELRKTELHRDSDFKVRLAAVTQEMQDYEFRYVRIEDDLTRWIVEKLAIRILKPEFSEQAT